MMDINEFTKHSITIIENNGLLNESGAVLYSFCNTLNNRETPEGNI